MSKQFYRHLLALLWCTCANSFASDSIGWQEDSILHNGQIRHYRTYLPEARPPNPSVVIFLHGGTQSMRKIFRKHAGATRAWPGLADAKGFILVVPNGTNTKTGDTQGNRQNWNDCRNPFKDAGSSSIPDDVGFIKALIERMAQKYVIDKGRVYISGVSNGGMMAYRLASELGSQVAAVAVFIANQPVSNECTRADVPVPIMIMNGTRDPLMPWAGGQVAGKRGEVMSTTKTLDYWLGVNKAQQTTASVVELPDTNHRDDSHVIKKMYAHSAGGADVWFYEIRGGGHNIPSSNYALPRWIQKKLTGPQNRDIDGIDEAWSFFSTQKP